MKSPGAWAVIWVVASVGIFVSAFLAAKHRRAMLVGRAAVGLLFVVGGATFNALTLATGGHYKDFADASYIPFVHHTWRSVVAPHETLFITLLIVFELGIGLLAISGRRRTQVALVGAIAFSLGLMTFAWVYYAFAVPMIVAYGLLLRAERTSASHVGKSDMLIETRRAA